MSLRLHIGRGVAPGERLTLDAGATRHAQVRRVQPGDALLLFDGQGGQWAARVDRIGRQAIEVVAGDPVTPVPELSVRITLALGMPANERMDALVEKATELGVAAIQPLHCARSVLKLDAERAERRRAHWQSIAIAACEQSGRATLPHIALPLTLERWLAGLPAADARLLLSLDQAAVALATLPVPLQQVVALSGPEGGLTPAEEALALAARFVPVSLGSRVLRADTAPLALAAYLGLRL